MLAICFPHLCSNGFLFQLTYLSYVSHVAVILCSWCPGPRAWSQGKKKHIYEQGWVISVMYEVQTVTMPSSRRLEIPGMSQRPASIGGPHHIPNHITNSWCWKHGLEGYRLTPTLQIFWSLKSPLPISVRNWIRSVSAVPTLLPPGRKQPTKSKEDK